MIAQRVRQFFRDLFGSRLIQRLELDLLELREDYDHRLTEKQEVIDALRVDLAQARAKLELWETVIIPVASPVANLLHPKPKQTFETVAGPEPGSWAAIQEKWYRQQAEEAAAEAASRRNNDGVSVERRQEVEQ